MIVCLLISIPWCFLDIIHMIADRWIKDFDIPLTPWIGLALEVRP